MLQRNWSAWHYWFACGMLSIAAACNAGSVQALDAPSKVEKVTGAEGGSLTWPFGTDTVSAVVAVTVPPGALENDVSLTIEPIDVSDIGSDLTENGLSIAGTFFQFGPAGTQFAQPVRLAFAYDAAAVDDLASLRITTIEEGTWILLSETTVDPAIRMISASTSHFSPFGVATLACLVDEDCDDNDSCTSDTCGTGGSCTYEAPDQLCTGVCGDELAHGSEECDQSDLRDASCESFGLVDGQLLCTDNCTYDVSACCVPAPEVCDEVDNDCDGLVDELDPDLGPGACAVCGDGVAEGDEACDGDDMLGDSCVTLAFDTGTLQCTADCSLSVAGCSSCGNSVIEGSEVCEQTDLDGQDCITQGFRSGTLACGADCASFDSSNCSNSECSGALCGTP